MRLYIICALSSIVVLLYILFVLLLLNFVAVFAKVLLASLVIPVVILGNIYLMGFSSLSMFMVSCCCRY